jgi:phosphopantetheinyl transferase (holo-ACP synthase)
MSESSGTEKTQRDKRAKDKTKKEAEMWIIMFCVRVCVSLSHERAYLITVCVIK